MKKPQRDWKIYIKMRKAYLNYYKTRNATIKFLKKYSESCKS